MNRHRLLATFAATAAVTGGAAATASAATVDQQAAVSQNWAGYVAGGAQFSSVSGSWVQPTAKCGLGQTYSAFWVGLGGYAHDAPGLEQIGTKADCIGSLATDYVPWSSSRRRSPCGSG